MFSRLESQKPSYDSSWDHQPANASITDGPHVLVPSSSDDLALEVTRSSFYIFNRGEAPIIGTTGNDLLSNPGVTDDSLFGLQGADTLLSFGGVDILFGGIGDDLLFGGDLSDWLYGDAGDDSLYGEDGWDVLYADNEAGIAGDDEATRNLLIGGAGADMLFGALGRDTLDGGDDEDILSGGGGADCLQGGAGADFFLIDLSVNPILVSGFGAADTIADFSLSEGDVLSFGLAHGVVDGPNGPAPLIWRGSILAPSGPVAGLVLPGGDLGAGYLQAWLLNASEDVNSGAGWVVIDLDQNGLLGAPDILFRLQSSDLSPSQIFLAVDPASFAGWAGNGQDDILVARSSGSRLFGMGGADALLGGASADWLSGGDGQDTLSGDAGDDQLWGGAGDDWLIGGNGHDALYAYGPGIGEDDDASAANLLEGEAGHDSLYGGHGSDWLIGGPDDDFVYGDDGADSLVGGAGNDTLLGAAGADSLNGGDGANSIDGGGGDDTIAYGGVTDRLDGGDGHDWLVISKALSVNLGIMESQAGDGAWVTGFEAVDASAILGGVILLGGVEANHLIGGSGQDSLHGLAGDDILQAAAGNDTLAGGSGLNIMEGGAGDDVYYVDSPDDLVIESYAEGNDTVIASCDFYLPPDVEVLMFAPGGWARRGGGGLGHDTLIGNAIGIELLGGEGQDSLVGGSGDDTLIGGPGADTVVGGLGGDFYALVDPEDLIIEAVGAGNDTIMVSYDFYLPSMMEALMLAPESPARRGTGGTGHDRLIGNGNANELWGGDGNDSLEGGDGADTLEGSVGNDRLIGDGQQDSLIGGTGDDTLIGGQAADTMAGGVGNDLYLIDDPADVIIEAATSGSDTVITTCDLLMPSHVEVLVVGEGASNLYLVGRALGDVMIGNGMGHRFEGGAGDDVILAGGQSLTDITALFEGWI